MRGGCCETFDIPDRERFSNVVVFKKKWLCGSIFKCKMFCWLCLLFCPGTCATWTKTGYSNMRGFLSDCKKHEKAKSHISAFKTWKTFSACQACDLRVDVMISQARRGWSCMNVFC